MLPGIEGVLGVDRVEVVDDVVYPLAEILQMSLTSIFVNS
jgi:hypothetical protein